MNELDPFFFDTQEKLYNVVASIDLLNDFVSKNTIDAINIFDREKIKEACQKLEAIARLL